SLAGARALPSRYMGEAPRAFADFLAPMSFAAPRTPVIANVNARPYPTDDPSASVRSRLGGQITHAGRGTRVRRFLMGEGVVQFNEIGPGNVLTRMVQQIQQQKDALKAS